MDVTVQVPYSPTSGAGQQLSVLQKFQPWQRLNLQIAYDLEVAGEQIQARIEQEVLTRTAA